MRNAVLGLFLILLPQNKRALPDITENALLPKELFKGVKKILFIYFKYNRVGVLFAFFFLINNPSLVHTRSICIVQMQQGEKMASRIC